MSSSEVQRTLVKSPPELWAELGDPVALARHLGGLGDIHITRIDPEQSVEWETEDANGTVLIKPSGWGTKVTLTVTRKTPEAEPTLAPGTFAPPGHPGRAETGAEAAQAVEDKSVVEADCTADDDSQLSAGQAAQAESAAGAEPPAQAESTTGAEPPAQAESAAGAEPPAQAESAATAYHAVEADPPVEVDPAPDADPAPAPARHSESGPELLPRRGFFSRLFGRRPRKEAVEPEPSDGTVAAVWQPGALEETLAAESQVESPAPVSAARPRPGPTEVIVANGPHPDPAVTIGAAELPPEPAEVIVAEEPLREPLAAVANENAADELDGPRESAGESPDKGSSDPDEVPETPEEAAAAEVTEVLTAVLDRLGAAHHRPFSRG